MNNTVSNVTVDYTNEGETGVGDKTNSDKGDVYGGKADSVTEENNKIQ